jgi:type I restriction enzyme, S subunit
MIEGLKPYAEYKESKVPWIGRVPSDWRVERTKWIFRSRKELNVGRRNTNVLSLTLRGVVNNDPDSPEGMVPKDYATYQLFRKHDLVFKLIDLENICTSRVGLVHEDGIMSSAYVRLAPSKSANIRFFYFQFFDLYTRAVFNALGAGVRSTLGAADLGELRIAIPPPDEQAAIVRFLDHANRKIDGFIRAKRKLIGLLNEQKQAIIHRAVTRGLHPDVPLKPSGIPWLGDIPKHWETIRCGGLFREVVDVGHPKARLLSIDRIKGIIPQDETGRRTRASYDRGAYKRVKRGQLAYNLMNAFMGALGFSPYDGIVSPAYAVAQPLREIETRYFHYLLRTSSYTGEFNRLSYGIMYERNRLYFERFKVVRALLPPLDEQKAIADWIEANTGTLTAAIARTEREIALMQEYRTRLTSDLVTGKLDVREAVAKLPDLPVAEPAAEEAMDDIDN